MRAAALSLTVVCLGLGVHWGLPVGARSCACGTHHSDSVGCRLLQNTERNPGVLLNKLITFPTPYTFQVRVYFFGKQRACGTQHCVPHQQHTVIPTSLCRHPPCRCLVAVHVCRS